MSHHIDRLDFKADLLSLQQRFPETYPYLLASTAHSQDRLKKNSRYDILMAYPRQKLWLDNDSRLHGDIAIQGNDFLDNFDLWFSQENCVQSSGSLPFRGGWFIYLGYELAQQVEPVLILPGNPQNPIAALAARIPAAVIVDHADACSYLVAEHDDQHLLSSMHQHLSSLEPTAHVSDRILADNIDEDPVAPYFEQVARIKRYIYDGDIFQANLSRHWSIQLSRDTDDQSLFDTLSHCNPASFACLLKLDDVSIISSSPERLAKVVDGILETRPIAGTRPRSNSDQEDLALSDSLLSHPKERAEHIMLIDLERNDLGRVCEPGSIEVDELLTLESWQHVHHIVSNVKGKLRDGIRPGEILRAVFPGGTITGCPKVRCMQILAEQEQSHRGAYTGSAGYINTDGSMDTNILIRTLTRKGRQISFRAGGGIVADSDADHELHETRAKAKGLLQVFQTRTMATDETA